MAYYSDRFGDPITVILKILIGAGIVTITVALVLFLTNAVYTTTSSWELQLAVGGCVVMVMAFLSLRIFERL